MGKTARNVNDEIKENHPPDKPHLVRAVCPDCRFKRYVWLSEAEWQLTWKYKVVRILCDVCTTKCSPQWVKQWIKQHPEQNDTNTKC